jgi:hypothetical protein
MVNNKEIGKYILIQFSGGQPRAVLMLVINTPILILIETINRS